MGKPAARVETKRFEMDPDTAGPWDQVKGELHRRFEEDLGNGRALRMVSRIDLRTAVRDTGALSRTVTRLRLEN